MRLAIVLPALLALTVAGCTTGGPSAEAPEVSTTQGSSTTVAPTTVASSTTLSAVSFEDPVPPPGMDHLRLISSVSVGKLVDAVRVEANIGQGLDLSGDEVDPERSSERLFSGRDLDVVVNVVTGNESELLNPTGSVFVFQAAGLMLSDDAYGRISDARRPFSWNVMQRGLAGGLGGQWKMSLVNESGGAVKAQCVVRDEVNRFMRVNSTIEIVPNQESIISCIFDDTTNVLSVDVNGVTDSPTGIVRKAVDGREEKVSEDFGDVNPNGGATCAGAVEGGIGNVITVGNKPACGATLSDDDRFEGQIVFARLWKR